MDLSCYHVHAMSFFNSPGRFTPLGVVAVPRPGYEFSALQIGLLLALLMHFAGLYTYAIMISPKNNDFFSKNEAKASTETEVALVKIEPPKPDLPVPARPTTPTPPAVKPPPRVTIPTAKPVEVAKGSRTAGPTQHAPVRRPVTDVAPPVVASDRGTGPAVAVNNGRGAVGGDPNASGTGDGSTQRGDPNGVPGGNPNGNGGGGNPGERTTSAPDYNNWEHMPSEIRPAAPPDIDILVRAADARDWQALAQIWGLDYNKLSSLAYVNPYCLGQNNPELSESDRLNGRSGLVAVIVDIDANGTPSPQVQPSGDALMDRIAFNIAKRTRWLPALAYGRPTACRLQYNLSFSGFGRP